MSADPRTRPPETIAVTGATGFLGARLVRAAVDSGHRVHVIHRASSDLSALEPVRSRVGAHAFDGDTRSLVRILGEARPDLVYHLAAHYVAEHVPSDVDALVAANLLYGTQLLEAAAAARAGRVVLAGTVWQRFRPEDPSPANLYAATKSALEAIAGYYGSAHGMAVAAVRIPDTYGAGDPRAKLFRMLREAAAAGTPLRLSPGEQRLDLVDADDAVTALMTAGDRLREEPSPGVRRWRVSSGELFRLREVVELWQSLTGRQLTVEWGARPYRAREVMEPADDSPLVPGWKPARNLRDGIRRMEGLDG